MNFKNKYCSTSLMIKISKIFVFLIYFLLLVGSSYVFYKSYNHYTLLSDKEAYQQIVKKIDHLEESEKKIISNDINLRKDSEKIMMTISLIVFLLVLFVLSRRKYDIEYEKLENQNLNKLLLDIENYPDQEKAESLKKMIKNKNFAETYTLMSEMIQELHESKNLADDANKTKTLFLANMSHELRTPLNGIVGFTKILKSTDLDDEQDDFVNVIRKSSEDLLTIINDILDISKIENGGLVLEELYFNPMEEFENVIESYAANASKKDIDFSLWIDPMLSSVLLRSDPGKIKQIMINLISNAVKFTEDKGSIDVLVENVESTEEDISIKFSVKDSGIGISDEQIAKVFEAFTQADSSTSRKYGGTGLGLTISSSLVNALGGALKVESKVGEGSTFYFTLKLAYKKVKQDNFIKPMKIAIYAPSEVQSKDSDHYLEEYLNYFEHPSLIRFKTFEECLEADKSLFDGLYIHYDKINHDELEQIVAKHHEHSSIILVTKLNKRHLVKDISDKFEEILYEPITYSKVEKSFNFLATKKDSSKKIITKRKRSVSSKSQNIFNDIHALVVEDNLINQKMIQHTLKNMGITSVCANNGEEGVLEYTKNHDKYDIIFMDIHMPLMNGIDATKKILEYEVENHIEHTPIVAVTANALKGDRERFLSEGMDEYVSKPIDVNKFLTVVKMFFKESNSVEEPICDNKNILLYKETAMEAKIVSAMLSKLDYKVDVVENLEELKEAMQNNIYKSILLDRVHNELTHEDFRAYVSQHNISSMLFVDSTKEISSSDKESFTFISDKVTDYESIKRKVDEMTSLAQAS